MDAKEYNKIMERLDFIEFRQQLLFDNDDVSRSIFEYGFENNPRNEMEIRYNPHALLMARHLGTELNAQHWGQTP